MTPLGTMVTFTWDGDAMQPLPRFRPLCNRQFVVGQEYPLAVNEERSSNSHNHLMAAVAESWKNLPEDLAQRFPTPTILRKHALIVAGFANERLIPCDTEADAHRIAALVHSYTDYAIVEVRGATVRVLTAQSQRRGADGMDKETFQKSKQAVLEIVSEMIGVSPEALKENAGQAA